MTRCLGIIALLSIAAIGSGQDATQPPTVTPEQFRELQKRIDQRLDQLQRATNGVAGAQKDAASSAEKQSEGVQKALTGNKNEVVGAIQKEGRQQTEAIKDVGSQLSHSTIILAIIIGVGFLALAIAMFRKIDRQISKMATVIPEAHAHREQQTDVDRLPILQDDPTPKQIKEHAELLEARGIYEFDADIRLPQHNNVLWRGRVSKDNLGFLVIKFPGVAAVSLENRRRAAEESFLLAATQLHQQPKKNRPELRH